uniref:Uncharacterized protein n=1 Tax=Romanomermis culicivorax TaxID=13658 RepID=A0A915JGW4_ROMCU
MKKIKRKGKRFGAETGAKVAGTKIAGAQTATSEMTKSRTGYRQNGGAEMEAPKCAFPYFNMTQETITCLNKFKSCRHDLSRSINPWRMRRVSGSAKIRLNFYIRFRSGCAEPNFFGSGSDPDPSNQIFQDPDPDPLSPKKSIPPIPTIT